MGSGGITPVTGPVVGAGIGVGVAVGVGTGVATVLVTPVDRSICASKLIKHSPMRSSPKIILGRCLITMTAIFIGIKQKRPYKLAP